MYIRWKEKPREPQWGYDEHHLWRRGGAGHKAMLYSAYLAESRRINGKPRQRTTYLASIRDTQVDHPYHRLRFWQAVQTKMQVLGLSPEQQQLIKKRLLERIPDVSQEQLEEADRRMEAMTTRLRTLKAEM